MMILLNTKNEKIEKINKNDLIEFINEIHIDHFTLCYGNDLNKCNYDSIDDLYCTIKRIKRIVSNFDFYDTFYLYSNDNGFCVILSHENDEFKIYDIYDDEFCKINEYDFEFTNKIEMYEYINGKLIEQIKINEQNHLICEN